MYVSESAFPTNEKTEVRESENWKRDSPRIFLCTHEIRYVDVVESRQRKGGEKRRTEKVRQKDRD